MNKYLIAFFSLLIFISCDKQDALDETVIDFIVDDNPLKQGLYTPISHIPVLSTKTLYDRKPDYVLILAWNFAEPIMKAHKKYAEDIEY